MRRRKHFFRPLVEQNFLMRLLQLLVSLICLLSVLFAAKINNRCELCSERSHVFKDHFIKGDSVEEIRNLIQEYFKRLKKGTHTKTYSDYHLSIR